MKFAEYIIFMKIRSHLSYFAMASCLSVILNFSSSVKAAAPDLTATGSIAAIDRSQTYNLGPTGLRGWIYAKEGSGEQGTISALSRQILITVVGANTPASGVLAVDDVILGVGWGSGPPVTLFNSDARKNFGNAIGEAEKPANRGILKIKRWRAGAVSEVELKLPVMGAYTDTAPFNCPKSTLILANACNYLVKQVLASPKSLEGNYGGAITALALLGAIEPSHPDYAAVKARLETFAHSLAATDFKQEGMYIWTWGYVGIFLSEYYLITHDASILPIVNKLTVELAKVQSRYGTFGHGGSFLKADGSLHGTIPPYGPVNSAGIPGNIAIVMGKKALLAGHVALDPEIDPAITRASNFFSYYMNKGPIPYGEHEPYPNGHASNGKDPMCAVLFGLQEKRVAEAEYFSRMSVASYNGREYGHTGQGFSYLWAGLGANMGGKAAAAAHLRQVRWHLDLERRSDGSFIYDGSEQYGAGKTADGSYLGASGYNSVNPTASYILSYALPLQKLYLTGKDAIPAHTLDAAKIASSIVAGNLKQTCITYSIAQLITALSDYDPVARHYLAMELATRSLAPSDLNMLITLAEGNNVNQRQGACEVLGLVKTESALPALTRRLSDPDLWVRAKAARALKNLEASANPQVVPMLKAMAENATNPEVIDWSDPLQIANGFLAETLFGGSVTEAITKVPKNILYPAFQAGLKQPDSKPRTSMGSFVQNQLTQTDVDTLILDLIEVTESSSQADTMWSMYPRAAGISTLAKFKIAEGIPLALQMQIPPKEGFGWGNDNFRNPALKALALYGDAARWTLPTLRGSIDEKSPNPILIETIATIEAATSAPILRPGLPVAYSQVVTARAAKAITLTGFDQTGDKLTYQMVTAPLHGKLSGSVPNLTYTPEKNYQGIDSFTFKTHDGKSNSLPGTVSIIIGAGGTGLKAEYYDNADFTNLKLTRVDREINFDWGKLAPDSKLAAESFSVRWNGFLLAPETGKYQFSTLHNDGIRLYINGNLVIDHFVNHSKRWSESASIALVAGRKYDIQVDYYKNTEDAAIKLKWTGPSFAGANGAIIGNDWLYDGKGVENRELFGYPQNLRMPQNTKKTISLSASGETSGGLTYSITTPPTHGVLTGTPPNLVYTPEANYNKTDSFNFVVNNGKASSKPSTVSIAVLSGFPIDFFWANAAAGTWGGASNWVDPAGWPKPPVLGGQPFYQMNLNKPGTYIVTQDSKEDFLMNQLNFAAGVTIAGTNAITLTTNGPLLPQVNQNSSSMVTLSNPLNLAAMTAFNGSSGPMSLKGLIAGGGGIIQNNTGILEIQNVANTYSGGTMINAGIISLPLQADGALGTGSIMINKGGTLMLNRINSKNPLILNGGTIQASNGYGNSFNNLVNLKSNSTLQTNNTLSILGNISGVGGLTKIGQDPLVLSGSNSFSGGNRVQTGILQCSTVTAMGSGPLEIAEGAMVKLDYTGNGTISGLIIAGIPQVAGTYGSTASDATYKNDKCFSGKGTVTVVMIKKQVRASPAEIRPTRTK